MKTMMPIMAWLAVSGSFPVLGAVNVQEHAGGKKYATVWYKGPVEEKYDIVFLGDGFTANEQAKFNDRVNTAVAALQAMRPYKERDMCWANIWRVNVVSQQSGVDHPLQNSYKNTELDCTYGDDTYNKPERLIYSKLPGHCLEAAAHAPAADAIFILVNDEQWGGGAGQFVTSSIHPGDVKHPGGFAGIITHELGHRIGLLADEYEYKLGADIDGNLPYLGSEPSSVNLTTQTDPGLIKWKDLIAPGTTIPTTVDQPMGVVGLWEGGGYHAYDIYRPAWACHMKEVESGFCEVCERRMRERLHSHCADCDVTPFHPECMFLDLHKHLILYSIFHCKFPLPICPLCPDGVFENQIIYILEGAPPETALRVVDQAGGLVAEGVAGKRGLEVAFGARVDQQYYIEVTCLQVPAGGVELVSTLLQNGLEQELAQ